MGAVVSQQMVPLPRDLVHVAHHLLLLDRAIEYAVNSLFLVAQLRTGPTSLDRIVNTRLCIIAHETILDRIVTINLVLLFQLN